MPHPNKKHKIILGINDLPKASRIPKASPDPERRILKTKIENDSK
jgi:hypothetical protein